LTLNEVVKSNPPLKTYVYKTPADASFPSATVPVAPLITNGIVVNAASPAAMVAVAERNLKQRIKSATY